ncbi:MAG: Minf_1886 family protein, partial [Planctomycetota bacterium]
MEGGSLQERLSQVVHKDPRFQPEAYQFVFEALDYTVRLLYGEDDGPQTEAVPTPGAQPSQHVTGQDLLEGIRDYALDAFGCLAAAVFESWGVKRGEDFGEMVFNLVEHGLMGKQETDSKDDFSGGFDGRPFD